MSAWYFFKVIYYLNGYLYDLEFECVDVLHHVQVVKHFLSNLILIHQAVYSQKNSFPHRDCCQLQCRPHKDPVIFLQ